MMLARYSTGENHVPEPLPDRFERPGDAIQPAPTRIWFKILKYLIFLDDRCSGVCQMNRIRSV